MKRLYFVRHARTVENEQGRMIGTRDGTLSLEGQRQADRLVQALLQEPIDLIISSTLRRAQETARILNAALKKPLLLTPLVNERSLGTWAGISREEFIRRWQQQDNPLTFRPGGGESYQDLLARARSFLQFVLKIPEGNVLIVSHGRFLKILLNFLRKKPLDAPLELDNCSLSLVVYDKTFTVLALNYSLGKRLTP